MLGLLLFLEGDRPRLRLVGILRCGVLRVVSCKALAMDEVLGIDFVVAIDRVALLELVLGRLRLEILEDQIDRLLVGVVA